MASTKQKQQQAKQAKMKANIKMGPMMTITAYRHGANGVEMVSAAVELIVKGPNAKADLLKALCVKPWGHNNDRTTSMLAEYIPHTRSYAQMKMLGVDGYGMEIHFYETDKDNPNLYSCREAMLMPVNTLKQRTKEWVDAHAASHDVRTYN